MCNLCCVLCRVASCGFSVTPFFSSRLSSSISTRGKRFEHAGPPHLSIRILSSFLFGMLEFSPFQMLICYLNCFVEEAFVEFAPPMALTISLSIGCDHWCDPLPIDRHGDPLPALPLSLSLLGGFCSLLCVFATHYVQKQSQGSLLMQLYFAQSCLGMACSHISGRGTS